jgi:hypothetical protein
MRVFPIIKSACVASAFTITISLKFFATQPGVRDQQDIPWAESLYQVQALTNELLPALIEAALPPGLPVDWQ